MTSLKRIQQGIMTMVNASPVALLVVLFTWSYWAYNYRMSWAQYINKGQVIQGVLYILVYQPIFILCTWSYWTVCKTSPGYTIELHKNKNKDDEEQDELLTTENELGFQYPITVKRDGARRYCQKWRNDVMRSKYFNPWDLGYKKNIQQVLGKNKWTMFLPIGKPQGNGAFYPINSYAYETLGMEEDIE
ncbi:hypothetical protein G6F70_003842 [Rhizopus microsporus]|nr:hypothetical protein G6F71_003812 [Rhizopus microsporus]KAG1200687.1 hypothetical protein G6F70_003842 [Rhizopus microsporus]KAG1212441.1 hypothetical protein G6F69_003710 [Rhizopus microsporus]KAG1234490.1 hypothetical protein G6F67_003479 [Rhizopus microsporus]KAG1266783.1 hypothetical protein G6F68_002473 [Rhizopus microsporus]